MIELLKTWLRLKEDDLKPTFLLLSLSFTLGGFISLYLVSSQTLFLAQYGTEKLPIAFIASGLLGLIVWYFTSIIDKGLSFGNQIRLKCFIALGSIVLLTIIQNFGLYEHASFILYVWLRVALYLSIVILWGLANNIFNLESAKRVFPIIAIGEGVAYMLGFFSVSLILKFIPLEQLLYLCSIAVLISVLLAGYIHNNFIKSKTEQNVPKKIVSTSEENIKKQQNFWSILDDPYLKVLLLLALFPVFSRFFIDFLFLDRVNVLFEDKTSVANFLALFFGFSSMIEMLLKSTLASRFYSRYGILAGILFFPVALMIGIGLSLIFNITTSSLLILFSFIALVRLLERAIRSSFYDPSFQILYQPIESSQRTTFQNQVEGVPKTIGTLLAGFVLLMISYLGTTEAYFNIILIIFFIVLSFWFYFSLKLTPLYKSKLNDSIFNFQKKFKNNSNNSNINPNLTQVTLSSYLQTYKLTKDYLLEVTLNDLKLKLSKTINILDKIKNQDIIEYGLQSNSYKIQKMAIFLMGKKVYPELLLLFSKILDIPILFPFASKVLKHFPAGYHPDIVNLLSRGNISRISYQLFTDYLLSNMEGEVLTSFISQELGKTNSKYELIFVQKLLTTNSKIDIDLFSYVIREKIENNIEITVRLMQTYHDLVSIEHTSRIDELLTNLVNQRIEHILNLCGVLFDKNSITVVKEIILRGEYNQRLLAMEILDASVDSQTKTLLMPLLNLNTYEEIINHYKLQFPQKSHTVKNRLKTILNDSIEFTPVCLKLEALNTIQEYKLTLSNTLISLISFPNEIIKTMAVQILQKKIPLVEFKQIINRQNYNLPDYSINYQNVFDIISKITQKIGDLYPNLKLDDLQTHFFIESVTIKDILVNEHISLSTFYVLKGKVSSNIDDQVYQEGSIFLMLNIPVDSYANLVLIAEEPTKLILIDDRKIIYLIKNMLS